MRRFLHATTITIVGLSMVIASGCFSYHKTTTETPAQVEPSEPPAPRARRDKSNHANQRWKRPRAFDHYYRPIRYVVMSRTADPEDMHVCRGGRWDFGHAVRLA